MRRQFGMTLLEVLIALAIFSLIGVASYRVMFATINIQKIGDEHSQLLSRQQKVLAIIDRDFNQYIDRDVQLAGDDREASLLITENSGDFLVKFSRAGRANPLGLTRSHLFRVAYDIGPHPQVNNSASQYYRDQKQYLRRYSWTYLDHAGDQPQVQALLAEIESFQLKAMTDKSVYSRWPQQGLQGESLIGLELQIEHPQWGRLDRFYKVL
jgi:general secretion pathway protein J